MAFPEVAADVRLHWREAGRGRPLVLVHGWAMSSGAFTPQLEELAASSRVIAYDLRGHGGSAGGEAGRRALASAVHPDHASDPGFRIEDHADDLVAFMEGLELRGAVLAGWSMGGQVALEALPRLGERVAGLALMSATAKFAGLPHPPCRPHPPGTGGTSHPGEGGKNPPGARGKSFPREEETRPEGAPKAWPHGLPESHVRALSRKVAREGPAALARFFDGLFVPGELPPGALRGLRDAALGDPPCSAAAALSGLEALLEADQRGRLAEVRVPTLVVHGALDPICPPAAGRELARAIRNARLEELPGTGHAPHLSRSRTVNALLKALLAEVGRE